MQATLHAPSWRKLGCRHSAPQQTNDRLCANQPGSAATHTYTHHAESTTAESRDDTERVRARRAAALILGCE